MTYDIVRKSGVLVEVTTLEKRPKPRQTTVRRSRERGDVLMPRRSDNLRRSKQRCLRLLFTALQVYGCPLLVSLTFAGDASDSQYAGDALSDFQKRLRITYPASQSLFVPEVSPKGRIHFHGLLFGLPQSLGDIKKNRRTIQHGTERTDRTLAKLWREGFVDVLQTDGGIGLAYYVTGYFHKGAGEVLFVGMRIPRVSHGFPKPEEYRGVLANLFIEHLGEREPRSEWESSSDSRLYDFFGKITKKTYILSDEEAQRDFFTIDEAKLKNELGIPDDFGEGGIISV